MQSQCSAQAVWGSGLPWVKIALPQYRNHPLGKHPTSTVHLKAKFFFTSFTNIHTVWVCVWSSPSHSSPISLLEIFGEYWQVFRGAVNEMNLRCTRVWSAGEVPENTDHHVGYWYSNLNRPAVLILRVNIKDFAFFVVCRLIWKTHTGKRRTKVRGTTKDLITIAALLLPTLPQQCLRNPGCPDYHIQCSDSKLQYVTGKLEGIPTLTAAV